MVKSKIVITVEDGIWAAHDPAVPGVYGLGPSRKAALADLVEATALLDEYLTTAAEDAADVRAADASMAEILAGGKVYTHAEVLAHLGLEPNGKEDVEGVRLTDETKTKIRVRLAETTTQKPVKVGIVSDIHGDIVALDAALARLRAMKCDQIWCAGDLLDVEPFGEEVVQRIKAEGIFCIRGNHERWALERRRRQPDLRRSAPSIVEAADLFTGGAELSHDALVYLATLPASWSAELAGVRVAMWHARPGSDMEGIRA